MPVAAVDEDRQSFGRKHYVGGAWKRRDGPNMLPLKEMDGLLRMLIEFDRLAKKT